MFTITSQRFLKPTVVSAEQCQSLSSFVRHRVLPILRPSLFPSVVMIDRWLRNGEPNWPTWYQQRQIAHSRWRRWPILCEVYLCRGLVQQMFREFDWSVRFVWGCVQLWGWWCGSKAKPRCWRWWLLLAIDINTIKSVLYLRSDIQHNHVCYNR